MYCCVCGGPFTNYTSWKIQELASIDTTWLDEAVIEYYNKEGQKTSEVDVNDYDAYGRFTDPKTRNEHDVVALVYEQKARLYHKACHGRPTQARAPLKRYQGQFFNIEALVKAGQQDLLKKPECE